MSLPSKHRNSTKAAARYRAICAALSAAVLLWPGHPASGDIHWDDSPAFAIDALLAGRSVGSADSGGFGLDCTLIARGWADSNTFNLSGESVLSGTVFDLDSGDPIVAAEVTAIGHSSTTTGPEGEFGFDDLPEGLITLSASKEGYYTAYVDVEVDGESETYVDIGLIPSGPVGFGVVEVRGNYCGPGRHVYYLDGVGLTETFTAMVDWEDHTPGTVWWYTPYHAYEDDCPGETVERSFDMGYDFGPLGTLTVVAVAEGGAPESSPYVVNFKVIPVPAGMVPILLHADPSGNTLKYATASISGEEPFVMLEGAEGIPEDIPLFGGEDFKFGAQFDARAEVNADGTASAPFFSAEGGAENKIKMAGVSFSAGISGAAIWHWDDAAGQWIPGGRIGFDMGFEARIPPVPHYIFFLIPVPPFVIPVFFQGGIEVGVGGELWVLAWAPEGEPNWQGTLNLDPFPGAWATAGVGIDDILCVGGTLGGKAVIVLVFPNQEPLQTAQIVLTGEVFVEIWFIETRRFEWPFLEYVWDIHGWRPVGGPIRLSRMSIIPRDYLKRPDGYAVFRANEKRGGDARDVVTEETCIQENVFGRSTPDLAASGDDLILVWVYDDPNRTPVNRTEIVYSEYDSVAETWSEPAAVADDRTADFHPRLGWLPNGDVLLAWENLSEVLEEPADPNDPNQVAAKLEEAKSVMEIAVATYDAATGTWGPQAILSDNEFLDRSPRIAAAGDGTGMLTWVSNAGNHVIGTTELPNDIRYAIYDGADWSEPADVEANVPSIVKSAMAYDGSNAVLVFAGDGDDDMGTPEDRELFAVEYAGGNWGAVMQLTMDDPNDPNEPNAPPPVEDANPQVAYDSHGNLLLVWYRGGDIVMATDLSLSDLHTIVDLPAGASMGAADFRLATGPTGQISLVWQEPSADLVDVWYAVYDPTLQVWSQPQRLTRDDRMEYGMAPVYDASGDLVVAYDKVQMVYETRTVEVGGEEVEIENVPVLDQRDFYVLRHIVGGDLGIGAADISLSPGNPLPGTEATITATVHNLGDVPAENIEVVFYDGDPAGGGTLIDTVQTIVGPLVGGEQGAASVTWTVPPATEPREIYVVVDPNQVQEDRDRTNNSAFITVLAPDLTISEIGVQSAGPDRLLTVRVANDGVLPVTDVEVTLHKNRADGPILTAFVVPELVPGAYHDLSYRWESPPEQLSGVRTVYAIVDEADAIAEFDETNNTRSALVPVKRFDAEPLETPAAPVEGVPKP